MISHFHARAIDEIKNAQLLGIYSISKTKSGQFAEKNQCTAYATLIKLALVRLKN